MLELLQACRPAMRYSVLPSKPLSRREHQLHTHHPQQEQIVTVMVKSTGRGVRRSISIGHRNFGQKSGKITRTYHFLMIDMNDPWLMIFLILILICLTLYWCCKKNLEVLYLFYKGRKTWMFSWIIQGTSSLVFNWGGKCQNQVSSDKYFFFKNCVNLFVSFNNAPSHSLRNAHFCSPPSVFSHFFCLLVLVSVFSSRSLAS